MMKLRFGNVEGTVEFFRFAENDRTAIVWREPSGGHLRINVNLPDEDEVAEDEIAIKNYSENAGMLEAAIDCGLIQKPHRVIVHEYADYKVEYPICRLTAEAIAEQERQESRA